MIEYNFGALQNGSDIRGVAMEVPGGKAVNLGDVATARIAKGFLFWLSNKTGKKPSEMTVSIGRDSRLTGPELEAAFAYALIPYGVTVLRAGLASTPAMFMSTVFDECRCDGAVMITASHLPKERNGFKFFDADGGLNKGDITDIITFAESDSILGRLMPVTPGSIEDSNLMDLYCAHLRKLITDGVGSGESPLSGLKITVDAGNGGGGFYARNVLEPLGADVSSSQFLEPDGEFPNHAPNPEDKAAMASICSRVKEAGSDLGLIFDTDVDRASAVDENGCEINRNKIVALAAALIENPSAGTTVVTDSITSGHSEAPSLQTRIQERHKQGNRAAGRRRRRPPRHRDLGSRRIRGELLLRRRSVSCHKDRNQDRAPSQRKQRHFIADCRYGGTCRIKGDQVPDSHRRFFALCGQGSCRL